VKPGFNGLLDAARQVYTEAIEDVYAMANNYRALHNLPSLKVQYNSKRGYFFTVPVSVKNIPTIFGSAAMQGKKWMISTDQLETLNIRIKESLKDIYLMTDRVVGTLMGYIR